MRIAFLSDMHGNAAAFDAVLTDLEQHAHDQMVVAGDIALFGPRPRECVERVRALSCPVIRGNTDVFVASNDERYRSHALIAWTREQMGEANTDWMRELPFDHRIRPPGQGDSAELLIVHATPTDVEAILITQPNEISGHTVTPEDEARGMLGEARASLIVYGHIHYFSEGVIGTQRVASIGAIGFPFDGDPTAAYAILEWDGASWNVEPHRVPYDHKAVAAEIVAQDTFLAAPRAERILLSRPVPFE
ncbi:MAG: metallophosphoesterase family protein [Planctomycetota bacterium]